MIGGVSNIPYQGKTFGTRGQLSGGLLDELGQQPEKKADESSRCSKTNGMAITTA